MASKRIIPAVTCVMVITVLCGSTAEKPPVANVILRTGKAMPAVGLGTSQVKSEEDVTKALDAALEAGYRHIDTAYVYRNEKLIGNVLKRWLDSGKVKREDLFVTTKLPINGMRASDVPYFLGKSLEALQLDYVDMYLIHHPTGITKDGLDEMNMIRENATDTTTDHLAIWNAMEKEVGSGRTKSIGLSNFNETQIERVLKTAVIPPSNLQVELHLFFQQPGLVEFCQKKNIQVTAFAPFGSPGSKWYTNSTGKNLPDLFDVRVVKKIATNHSKTPAQVLLRHGIQKGLIVIPKSSNPERLQQNIDVFDFTLDRNEMSELNAEDRGAEGRLFSMKFIKGVTEKHPEYPWPSVAS